MEEPDLLEVIDEIRDDLEKDGVQIIIHGPVHRRGDVSLTDALKKVSNTPVDPALRKG